MARKIRYICAPGLIGATGCMGLVASARGSIINYDLTWGPTQQPAVIPLTFPTFNTSLGTLTSVTIAGNASMSVELIIVNITSSPQGFTSGFVSEPITVTNGNGTSFSETINTIITAGNITGTANAGPLVATDFAGNVTNTPFPSASIQSSEFPTFESPGGLATITIDVNTGNVTQGANFGSDPPSMEFSSGHANIQGDVQIAYTYTAPIPEPAAINFAVIGGSMTLLRRRRNSRRQSATVRHRPE